MELETSALRNAILRVWTPAVGARSLDELMERNVNKIIDSQGLNPFTHLIVSDHVPLHSVPEVIVEWCFDTKPPFELSEMIISGSWSEGLFVYGYTNIGLPDLDRMCVLKHIKFSEDDQKAGNLLLREDTPFVYAYITDEDALKMWSGFLVDDENLPYKRLSSKKLKEKLHDNYNKLFLISDDDNSSDVGTGAAMEINKAGSNPLAIINKFHTNNCFSSKDDLLLHLTIQDFRKECNRIFPDGDIVLSISCDGWPSCAKEWITRHRVWPIDDLVQKIIHDGFHIVPKSSTEGDFRLSFSYAETTLIENLTELQHKVLRSFKAVVKCHQNSWSPNIKEIITTYHLKTVAFWHFEKVAQDSCTEEFLVNHLVLLLQELAEGLRKRELPMYFMPKVNLFKNVEDPEEAADIAKKIERLCLDFPQTIKAVENITFGLGRTCGVVANIKKICENELGLRQEEKRSEAIPKHEKAQQASSVFDSLQKIFRRNLFEPFDNINFATHKAGEESRGTGIATSFKSNVQDAQPSNTEEFIDLD